MAVDAALRRELLRQALATRLDEVRECPDRPQGAPPAAPESTDVEETLRVLMVRLWPRVRSGAATAEERRALFSHLFALREYAASDDLRFLDAWNNAYEAVGAGDNDPHVASFRAAYAELLAAHVERLRE